MDFCTAETRLDEILEEAMSRLKRKGTWKIWRWPLDDTEFFDAETFRQHVLEKHIKSELRELLPKLESKPVETPAENSLRRRM